MELFHLRNLNSHKSMGPSEMHPKALQELADAVTKSLSIYTRSYSSQMKSLVIRKKTTSHPFLRKVKRDGPGNCQPVNLTSVQGKIMEHFFLEAVLRHLEDREVIWEDQHGLT